MAERRLALVQRLDRSIKLQIVRLAVSAAIALLLVGCSMLDATIHPVPGPWANVAAGDGWRLLAAGQGRPFDEGYNVSVATTSDEWQALWAVLDPVNPEPLVDMDSEIVASFAHGIGSSCQELRLDDVVINAGAGVIYTVTSDPLGPRACTDDLVGSAFFVVALARDAMPRSPFAVRLRKDSICGGACGFTEVVSVDLAE